MSVESIARIVVAVVSVVWLVGCAGGETHDDTSRSVERMQAIVEDAREAGVTQAQMAALEASLAQGAMTYETLASLMPDFQECAAGVGAEVQIRPPQDEPGSLLIPDYAVFVDPDDEKAALRKVDECALSTFGFAGALYTAQPSALEAYDAHFEQRRDDYVACLRGRGVDIVRDATVDELVAALSEDMRNSGGSAMSACYQGTELAVRRH